MIKGKIKKTYKKIRKELTIWREIKKPPKWVEWAAMKYESKIQHTPYGKYRYYRGKNFIYRVFWKTLEQGRAELIYHRKKRIK